MESDNLFQTIISTLVHLFYLQLEQPVINMSNNKKFLVKYRFIRDMYVIVSRGTYLLTDEYSLIQNKEGGFVYNIQIAVI